MTRNGAIESVDLLADRLRVWLSARIPDAAGLTIEDAVEPKQGFSSRTVLFRARWSADGAIRTRDLVARIQRKSDCPMLADVFHQYRVLEVAGAEPGVRVPHLFMAETDPAPLGQPFFLMDRVEGRVPSDFPSFHAEGWVRELPADPQARLWANGVAQMERLHRIPWYRYPFLGGDTHEPPTARFYLDNFIGRWLDWAGGGRSYPVIEDALRYLIEKAPPVRRAGVVWNDARMGNVMFADDLEVAALFDFEVATLGPPEIDLAWWLYAEDIFSINFGHPRLPGIPDEQAAIRSFERLYGWPMPDFDYYLAIAALKHAVLAIRDYGNGKVIELPEALPDFAIARLRLHLNRHAGAAVI
jgi:aminoglycoside phosphotransferase (APT) family kinase protein